MDRVALRVEVTLQNCLKIMVHTTTPRDFGFCICLAFADQPFGGILTSLIKLGYLRSHLLNLFNLRLLLSGHILNILTSLQFLQFVIMMALAPILKQNIY